MRKIRPQNIELAPTELIIEWRDGQCSRHELETLRRNCPCATCRQARNAGDAPAPTGELPLLTGEASTATSSAVGFERVGRYGIRINWSDGHDAGIYTFDAFRDLVEGGE